MRMLGEAIFILKAPVIIIRSSHFYIESCICDWVASISPSDWIMSQSSKYLNLTKCDISVVKEFTKWIPKPLVRSAENTIELIIDQHYSAQQFTWKSPIIKCLNSSGMVSPPYVRL